MRLLVRVTQLDLLEYASAPTFDFTLVVSDEERTVELQLQGSLVGLLELGDLQLVVDDGGDNTDSKSENGNHDVQEHDKSFRRVLIITHVFHARKKWSTLFKGAPIRTN